MPKLYIRITDIEGGKPTVRVYRGPREALEALREDIEKDRRSFDPPGTAIHTPVPPNVLPSGFVPSYLVMDPIRIRDE